VVARSSLCDTDETSYGSVSELDVAADDGASDRECGSAATGMTLTNRLRRSQCAAELGDVFRSANSLHSAPTAYRDRRSPLGKFAAGDFRHRPHERELDVEEAQLCKRAENAVHEEREESELHRE
jgi:hypothetical protein